MDILLSLRSPQATHLGSSGGCTTTRSNFGIWICSRALEHLQFSWENVYSLTRDLTGCCRRSSDVAKLKDGGSSSLMSIGSSTAQIREIRNPPHQRKSIPLWKLLWWFRMCKASDPRDLIYGLTGIVGDDGNKLQPDYSLTKQEVYQTLTLWHLQKDGKLDVSFGQRNIYSSLPSWLCDWSLPMDEDTWLREYDRFQHH